MSIRALKVQQGHVHLVDEGTGRPVLFLHGNPDSADVWRPVIDRLKGERRCLAPDLPGFARSAVSPQEDLSLDGSARWVNELVQAIGLTEPVDLVVHDIGGPIGLAWAVKHPAKVRSLTIINTVFHADYKWHFWGRVWRTPLLGELSMVLASQTAMAIEMKRGSPKLTRQQIADTYALVSPTMQKTVLRFYRAADPWKLAGWDEQLQALTKTVPTQVLWGDLDCYIPKAYADRFNAKRVQHFPDNGHWLQLEAPDAVARALSTTG